MPLESFVHCQSGNPQDGQRVSGEAPTQAFRQLLRAHLPTGDSDKTYDAVPLNGDIGRTNVVSKLILAGIALKEAIEVDISTAKFGSIVPGFQPPDPNFELRVSHGTVLSELQWADLPG